jgi:predicted Zn-dependent protease
MAYEMGAIYEDGKEMEKVLAEYVQAAALGTSSPGEADSLVNASQAFTPSSSEEGSSFVVGGDERAYKRLRFLALRRNLGTAIDAEFRNRVQGDAPRYSFALAYSRHLGNLKRLEDLREFLLERVTAATDRDFLNRVQPLIQQHGFYEVQEAGLKRQIALATVADQKLPLQIELARFYESRNRVGDAQAVLEQLHATNPKSLGLIQDLEAFYWRHQLRARAIALLEQSVPLANVNYRKQFLFDQAQKLRTLKEYDRSIRLGQQLLKENPLDTAYSNFVAATLVQAGRHSELPLFFTEQLQVVRQSKLSPEEQKSRILALRRGMVDAQVMLKDFTAALGQYIEMINTSAEDLALVNEAAGFAEEHQLEPRLRRYYADTAQRSPKDHRWPLVLARLEDRWGHLADSLALYDAAIRVRPERLDLYEAKAGLQERLLDFASAVQTNQRLYDLSYKNPSYLLKIADLEVRLGRKAEAVDALKKAYAADGGLPAPQYFAMVDTLNRWGFLDEAKPLIDEGWKRFTERSASDAMGGRNLLRSAVEVSVKRRDAQNTLHALRTEYQRLDHVKEQPGGTQAYGNLEIIQQAFLDLGKAIQTYFNPEEKAGFQTFLQQIQPPFSPNEKETLVVQLAEAAGLPDLQEALRISIVTAHAQRLTGNSDANEASYRQQRHQLVDFYRRRQAHEKAVASLVSLWEQNPQRQRLFADLVEPALAARKLGNAEQEAAVLEKYAQASGGLYDPAVLGRYYELLAELKQEAKITQISQADRRMIPALVNALIDRNNLTLARTVLQNYGRRKTPVWTATQLAMTGAELKDSTPQVAAAFSTVLNLKPIGELLGVPADASRLLYGAEWYFYARSYGMHLHRLKDPQAEAYLPAQIEFAPVSPARQAQVGEFRLQSNELSTALVHFEQALELEPSSLQGLDGQAVVWMKQGQTEKATANWLKLLASQEELFSFPKLQRVLERVREFKLEATFREPAERFLKTYVKRNQTYRIAIVLPPALELFDSAEDKVALLTRLAGQTEALPFVESVLRLPAIEAGRLPLQPLYEAAIAWQRTRLNSLGGEDQGLQQGQLREFEFKFAEYLLQPAARTQSAPQGAAAGTTSPSAGLQLPSPSGRGAGGEGAQAERDVSRGTERAESLLASLEQEYAPPAQNEMVPVGDPIFRRIQFLKAQLYLQTNRAELAKSLLQSLYQRAEPIASRKEDYLKAADLLAKALLPVAARAVRQVMYEELLRQDPLVNAHSVGLAEVYLESKQPAKALAVLDRMRHAGIANEEVHRLAAQLLRKYRSTRLDAASPLTLGDKAKEMWRDLLKINPFATDDKLELAEALGKPSVAESQALLKSVLESRASTYAQQVEVARIAGKTGAQGLNFAAAELRFIAALEAWRGVPQPTTPAPLLPALPDAYYAPVYASGTVGGALPPLDSLRRALYLNPSGGQKVGTDSRLFAALVRGFDRTKRAGLLVDLFEQHGGGYGQRLFQYTDTHRGREAESGNPLEGPGAQEVTGPVPLTTIFASAAEKVALMKRVIAAYGSLQADDLAAQLARNSAGLLPSNRQAFLAQARQLDEKARQSAEALAARFSVNDTLGEELSRRKPVSRPRRERVRS